MGSIRLRIRTKDVTDAGTDSLVTAAIVRDGAELLNLRLDYPKEDDLERGALRNYDYYLLPRRNDKTPPLPDGIGQSPMPYPAHGVEFSNGLRGHLKLRLKIRGDDMWIKDNIDLFVREVRRKATSFDTLDWIDDPTWTYCGSWGQDVPMSTDSSEGKKIHTLNLN